ncbi:hypothetical protein SJA_C1-14130 [Sphingobium indicum UT26S]|uniref:Uncharacterized protein n=1 Tax=Sphingobium indicum (strain DSM 16413 / CCM 7287 / MTCC 6362 / UT26 / NBRC 101211 / UT26S) TaxID=452662 RepID=D4Z0W5_SPHIU|nr:hypothetical protein SJA_C1-14130 [Sphingobium indicum UT26S]
MGLSTQLQQCDTIVDNRIFYAMQAVEMTHATLALFAPCCRHPVMHLAGNTPIKMVHVEFV